MRFKLSSQGIGYVSVIVSTVRIPWRLSGEGETTLKKNRVLVISYFK